MSTKPHKDLRSPLAKARDEWFESIAGQSAADMPSLNGQHAAFLRNRLELAFLAGAAAQREIDEQFRPGPK